jgi:hypothetical protein
MPYPNIEEMDDSIYSKSKPICSINVWTSDIDNEVNDSRPTIPVTNTINIELMIYDLNLSSNHVMDQTKNYNF